MLKLVKQMETVSTEKQFREKEDAGCVPTGRGKGFSMRRNEEEIQEAQGLSDSAPVGSALDPAQQVLVRIFQTEAGYFNRAREELLRSLRRRDDGQKVPACLACGNPRVDWVESLALFRCQDCGAEQDRVPQERRATLHGRPLRTTFTGPTARDALVFFAEHMDESTTHDRKEQTHG